MRKDILFTIIIVAIFILCVFGYSVVVRNNKIKNEEKIGSMENIVNITN